MLDGSAVRRELREKGYVVLRGIIEPSTIERARGILEKAVGAHVDKHKPTVDGGQPLSSPRTLETGLSRAYEADPDMAPVTWVPAVKNSFVFQQLLFRDHNLCNLLEQVIGRPPSLASRFNVRSKVPGSTAVNFPWHQDHAYFRMQYLLKKQPVQRLLAAWAPLLPTDERNGVIQLYAGSHLLGFIPHRCSGGFLAAPSECSPRENADAPSLRPGDVVLFTDLTLHRSGPNLCDSVRWSADWAFELCEEDEVCPPLLELQVHQELRAQPKSVLIRNACRMWRGLCDFRLASSMPINNMGLISFSVGVVVAIGILAMAATLLPSTISLVACFEQVNGSQGVW
eukprot:scaffold83807_cov37-Tisochrysis_lutea.AAC.2